MRQLSVASCKCSYLKNSIAVNLFLLRQYISRVQMCIESCNGKNLCKITHLNSTLFLNYTQWISSWVSPVSQHLEEWTNTAPKTFDFHIPFFPTCLDDLSGHSSHFSCTLNIYIMRFRSLITWSLCLWFTVQYIHTVD